MFSSRVCISQIILCIFMQSFITMITRTPFDRLKVALHTHVCIILCKRLGKVSDVLTEQQFRPVGRGGTQRLLLGHPSPAEVIQN